MDKRPYKVGAFVRVKPYEISEFTETSSLSHVYRDSPELFGNVWPIAMVLGDDNGYPIAIRKLDGSGYEWFTHGELELLTLPWFLQDEPV